MKISNYGALDRDIENEQAGNGDWHSNLTRHDGDDNNHESKDFVCHDDDTKVHQQNRGLFSSSSSVAVLLLSITSALIYLVCVLQGSANPRTILFGDSVQIVHENVDIIENNNNNSKNNYNNQEIQHSEMKSVNSEEQVALIRDHVSKPAPFSTVDPVQNLNLYSYDDRPSFSAPGQVFSYLSEGQKATGHPLPTNKWYQNMLLVPDGNEPMDNHRVYTVPYLIHAVGPVPGIKVHATRLLAMEKIVQVTFVDTHGLTLGAARSLEHLDDGNENMWDGEANLGGGVMRRYEIDLKRGERVEGGVLGAMGPLTPLGLTLKWNSTYDEKGHHDGSDTFQKMTSSLVRGMPYGTMHYHYHHSRTSGAGTTASHGGFFGKNGTLPTVVSEIGVASPPRIDSTTKELQCSNFNKVGNDTLVNSSIEVTFWESDYTWLIFYSVPVYVRCYQVDPTTMNAAFVIQVTRLATSNPVTPSSSPSSDDDEMESIVLTSRIALMNNCTRGTNPSHCVRGQPSNQTQWGALLHKHSRVFPGKHTQIDYTFLSDEEDDGGEYAFLQYDWDARRVDDMERDHGDGLLMYSLPHHREVLHSQVKSENSYKFNGTMHCTPSLNGQACVVKGSRWVLKESLDGHPSFYAPRPPIPIAIPKLSRALNQDISFRLPDYYARGAGDTYFSGKMLAKLARILLVFEEVTNVCANATEFGQDYVKHCSEISMPTKEKFNAALDHLRNSTEVWINGKAETPFVFDSKWAGIASCGCLFNDKTQACNNVFPDCPSFGDPGLDFGHAFYNDHHFHAGYHIYAASAVAHFDPSWGKAFFENVLLLIRDIANPSPNDEFFPTYRMKDWYLGNSWAGGIAMAYPNGRNQESSSESIAAYEAVSLFGSVMAENWEKDQAMDSPAKAAVARHIREVGRLLTSTEVRSADRYWHVRQSGTKSGIYPEQYKPLVVGIMWNMMAQFQTWFGNAPHLAYGIQLLPLTVVSERRDDIDWAKQLYPSFAESCMNAPDCDEQGWGILQHAILAEVGHPKLAMEYAEKLPEEAFTSAGGDGHSLTNTLWYYSTRPKTEPLPLPKPNTPSPSPLTGPIHEGQGEFNCGCPDTCTADVLNYDAGGFTCGDRIKWIMDITKKSEHDACSQVAGVEYTDICSGCDPNRCVAPKFSPVEMNNQCPPCTVDECNNEELNRCPVLNAPYVCTEGVNVGGCSMVPWKLHTEGGSNCEKCCQLSYKCLKVS
mmetsp:Transcript_5158/g.9805  ORF Transcript_5158/g.9805 Transcript_5158/m.9805 type:complete len:1224 (+) Transcript_5158:251-3922(+)